MKIQVPALLLVSALNTIPGVLAQEPQGRPSPTPGPTQVPVFPTGVDVVTVDVVVTEKNAGSVTGLAATDFIVTEDGTPQTITSFEAVQVPAAPSAVPAQRPRVATNQRPGGSHAGRAFVVVFDDVHLTPFQANRAKVAVSEFLKNGVREGDNVMLVSTGGSAWWGTRMMAGSEELITLLKRLEGRYIPDTSPERITDSEAMRIHVYRDQQVIDRVTRRFETYGVSPLGRQGSRGLDAGGDPQVLGRAQEVYYQSVTRNRITLGVLDRVLKSLERSHGRKSLILVSQGFIYDPQLDEFKGVVQASRRANCAVYFLDTEGLGGLSVYNTAEFGPAMDTQDIGAAFAENLDRAEGAESIAADSGGFTVKNTNDLSKGIKQIADESRVYYLVGYQPMNTARDGKFRKISVKVNRKGVQVRHRKGYYAPLEGGTVAERKKGEADPDIQSALDSPYAVEDVPLRMTHFVMDEALLGKASVSVVTEVDIRGLSFEERENRAFDTLDFLLVVAHRETGEYFRYDQKVEMKLQPETRKRLETLWFPIARDFELAPGGYQAKIVVRDKNGGKVGTVVHEFTVPELNSFRVSTPVISDSLQPPPPGEKDPKKAPPRATTTARRAFAAGDQRYVFCQYEVFGATKDKDTGLPKVSAGYVIRKSDGTIATQVEPTPIQPTSIGKVTRFSATSLQGYAPGDYEMVLSLKDELSGKTIEYKEPFSIVAAEIAKSGS